MSSKSIVPDIDSSDANISRQPITLLRMFIDGQVHRPAHYKGFVIGKGTLRLVLFLLRPLVPYVRPLERAYAHVRRGMTLGVRGLAFDSAGRILLVEHTYLPGWHLPGGGVQIGESAEDAIHREMLEETGLVVLHAELLGIFRNGRNHILCFVIREWRLEEADSGLEIRCAAWWEIDKLPANTSDTVRQRLKEVFGKAQISSTWA